MLSIIILTKNESEQIEGCIKSIKDLNGEIIVVDSYSTDNTTAIAKNLGAKVYQNRFVNFSHQRNFALSLVQNEWVLFLDADERATKEFKDELTYIMKNYKEDFGVGGFFIKRRTFFYGKDWGYVDRVQRLFYRKFLIGWEGEVHETPKIDGKFSELDFPILHFTHRDLTQMVDKTNEWSEFEAELRFKADHPSMNVLRFFRVTATGFLKAFISEKGYKNGIAGLVESMYQAFSMFITYAKLWEKQTNSISKKK